MNCLELAWHYHVMATQASQQRIWLEKISKYYLQSNGNLGYWNKPNTRNSNNVTNVKKASKKGLFV